MLFRPPASAKSNPGQIVVTGKSLAHERMRVPERAFFVADVLSGEVDYKPTIGQLARMVRVSVPSVHAARQIAPDFNARLDVLSGRCSLLMAAARHKNGKGRRRERGERRRQ